MRAIFISIIIVVLVWWVWAQTGYYSNQIKTHDQIEVMESIQLSDSTTKNIIGIQPFMTPQDYLNEEAYYNKLDSYLNAAAQQGWINDHTTILFPEYLGTWLAIVNEKTVTAETNRLNASMAYLLLSHPFDFMRQLSNHQGEQEWIAPTLFRMKAQEMTQAYQHVFRNLASNYQVTIIGGSLVLPLSKIDDNQIVIDEKGMLYNSTFVFYPDGTIDPHVIRKVHPITAEQGFTAAIPTDELPILELSTGKTAVLICADSWYPDTYQQIQRASPEVLLVPSYCAGNGTMATLWKGYDGDAPPSDVDLSDIGSIQEKQAWIKYALPGRINNSKMIGINVFLRGNLWDLGTDGDPFIVANDSLITVQTTSKAGLWNINF